jgi:glycosyltransferase involved in cell wall biosynthesis
MNSPAKQQKYPLISVVIPVFNHLPELERAIKSVLLQTFQDFEVIVVDDGSDEDVKSVCDTFGDERIRYFRVPRKNANAARNRGIKEAKGVYTAMLDADDEFLPDHLKLRVEKMKKDGCDGIFGSALVYDGSVEKVKRSRPLNPGESMADYLLTDGFCPTPSHFYRTEAAFEIEWDEDLFRNQDYDFSIRFADRSVFICDPRSTVRIHWEKGHKKKLTDIHFRSQRRFIEKHRSRISKGALVNYLYSMKKEAAEIGNQEQMDYYKKELIKISPGFGWLILLLKVKMKAFIRKMNSRGQP